MAEIEKMNLVSLDVIDERLERMRELFPEIFTEGGIDFNKLRLELGDEVDDGDERYAFSWKGKHDAIRLSQTPSAGTLRPCPELSTNWEATGNLFIEGENLEVLKLLQRSYHGSIKQIYIDPPYNTGGDFVYSDSYSDPIRHYLELANLQEQSNPDTSGANHTRWCNLMYPRLRLARELLSNDGAIFISIDDHEYKNAIEICHEIFGEANYIATIVRNTNSSKNQSLFVSVSHEYCLVYAKNIDVLKEKHADNKWAVEKNNVDEYVAKVKQLQKMGLSAEEITEELKTLTKYPRFTDFVNYWYFDERGLYRKGDMGGVPNGNPEPIFNPLTEKNDPVPPGGFRYKPDTMKKLIDEGRIHFHTDGSLPTVKRYLSENMAQRPKSIMSDDQRPDVNMLNKEFETPFDNPKQLSFIERIVSISDPDAIVLDFFAGSATTAHAVMKLNAEKGAERRFIMVQIPQPCPAKSDASKLGFHNICEIGEERLRKAASKIASECAGSSESDMGFKVFRLDYSGIEKPKPGQLTLNVMKPDRSELDIVYEMMLKWGLELTLPVEQEELAGYPCYTVAYGELVCCLAPGLAIDVLEAIAKIEPRRVLMLDSILDDSLKLNAVQIFKRVEERTGREVELRTV
ncbi:hypothetical protein B5G20_07455 [Collinsella sp. An7]|uniref:site-specific DNA-methyltransferase n=1 Tax=Collinsella sp. An7 TaxID=1965651 RepID=UPI000B3AD804|nr:site-specific DNA-methyltransferase [Collinsella sp. An7]OUN46778.1 hypothetical protein B5G20_07455 [Collinsella sp. An7]